MTGFTLTALMRVLVLALLAPLFASPADAQLGRVLDRARDRVEDAVRDRESDPPPAESEAATASPVASESSPAPVASSGPEPAPVAQPGLPAPAADLFDLLMTPFDTDSGRFHTPAHDLGGLFFGEGPAELVVRDATGQVVASQRYDGTPWQEAPRFVDLRPRQSLVYATEPAPGSYTLALVVGGATLGAVPFTLSVATGGDAFTPTTTWSIEGPWATTAVLTFASDDPSAPLRVNYWVLADDVPGDRVRVLERLSRDGTEVETATWSYNPSFGALYAREARFRVTRADLADGTYRFEAATEDGVRVRAFTFEVEGGDVVGHPDSALDTPRERFRTPRSATRYRGGWGGLVDRFWVDAE